MTPAATLAFDSCCPTASIAVAVGDHMAECTLAQGTHARLLMPMIEATLQEAGVMMGQVSTLVTTLGPGSFTGIRISLAAIHGFMMVRTHTLKTCTSLEAMAFGFFESHPRQSQCEVWINAGKQEAYTQAFTRGEPLPRPLGDITLKPLEAVRDASMPTVGNVPHIGHAAEGPSARHLCAMAAHLPTTPMAQAMPVYVRPPDAKPPAPFEWLATKA